MASKAKFVLNKEKKVTAKNSIEYLEKVEENLESILAYDSTMIKETLLHLGNISDKLATGTHIFIKQNYSAQRIKKLAFGQQSKKNVAIINGSIEFVKKQYKGNWEQLKYHRDLKNFNESNRASNTFEISSPIDLKLISVLDNKISNKLRYLSLRRITENQFQLGPLRTKFCLLTDKDEDGVKMDHLCLTSGNGVVIFDE